MKFINQFKQFWRDATPLEVISRDLAQAHLDRLEAESAVEYSQACLDLALAKIERLTERMREYK